MTMTAREAFERGTQTFNAHDIDGFAEVLVDDVAYQAPDGMREAGQGPCGELLSDRGTRRRRPRRCPRLHIVDGGS
jgi:hypothetical protein